MLFNSLEFAIFLPLVFLLYWFVFDYAIRRCSRQLFWQNLFVVLVSYVFYGWWNWRFLILIAFTSFCSWGSGLRMVQSPKPKRWLTLNILVNLLILGVFKYFHFFVDSFCSVFGIQSSLALNVILPVGISFYTFQALSYSIDVYRHKIQPTRDVVAFFAYVSFFPQLVAGPIERATTLLPQFEKKRMFDRAEASDGLRRILWGLFKKIVIADNCATYVDQVWANYPSENASTLALAAVLFSFQIYGDFSGYSDIAIGSAKLFGIRLRDNFLTPYFSRNLAEFWKRWHISLNTWFVDYVYIPLGGSRTTNYHSRLYTLHPTCYTKMMTLRNTFIIFLLSGLWHGANWTYVTWGLYHALLFVPLVLLGRTRAYQAAATWKQIPQILLTFALVTLGLIIFRAPSIADAWGYVGGLLGHWGVPNIFSSSVMLPLLFLLSLFVAMEWTHRERLFGLDIAHWSKWERWLTYIGVFVLIFTFGAKAETFIYFQF